MTAARLRVVHPGPLTTVQDLGRSGYQRYGVSVSGALDPRAFVLGNMLAGNDDNAAGLEITLGGAAFEFLSPAVLALTGADLWPSLDGRPAPMWQTLKARAGSALAFGGPAGGMRAYLCVAGGISVEPVLGSRSTHTGSRLGGLAGRALRPGDELPFGEPARQVSAGAAVPSSMVPAYAEEPVLRVIAGPQEQAFTEQGRETFFASTYVISDRADRQGVRLQGPIIEAVEARYDIVSDPVPLGSVQIPADGQPIVMLADRQPTGGYAKIGVVAGADMPLLAQADPGTAVRFQRITVQEAQAAAREQRRQLESVRLQTSGRWGSRVLLVNGAPHTVDIQARWPLKPNRSGSIQIMVDGKTLEAHVDQINS